MGRSPQPLPWAANKYLCTLIFVVFGVCSFCRLAAICKSLVHKNLDISVYARYSGWPHDVMHRNGIGNFYTADNLYCLASL